MIFLVVLSGKIIFLFSENMILFFRRKIKYNLFQKKYMEIWYFLQMPRKDGLYIKNHAGIWSFWHYLERWHFSWKIWYFFFGRKMKDDLSQEIHGNMIFSVYMYKCYKYDIILLQKNQRWYSPEKKHLKVIDILDRILERVPTILCTFMETFIDVLIYSFPMKKTERN